MEGLLPGYILNNGIPIKEHQKTNQGKRVANCIDPGTAAIVAGGDQKDFSGEREREIAEFDRIESEELDRLEAWCRDHGVWSSQGFPKGFTYEGSVSSGMEHFVYPGDGAVKKFTHSRSAGSHFAFYGEFENDEVHIRSASPAEYFARVAWHNQAFPASKITIESVSSTGVYTQQEMVQGRFPRDRHEIYELMELQGWDRKKGVLYHQGFGLYLLDLHRFNGLVVSTTQGDQLLPIDTILIPERHSS